MNILFEILPIIIAFGSLIGLVWFLKNRNSNRYLLNRLRDVRTIFGLLIVWTLFGFIAKLDFNQQFGCIRFDNPIFSSGNMFYTGMALMFLSIGFFVPKRNLGILFLAIELIFWLYKLFLVKGGYSVGYGGGVSFEVFAFDIIAMTLRLTLIKHIGGVKMKWHHVLALVFIIMILKVHFYY